jgi:hypothetical protein
MPDHAVRVAAEDMRRSTATEIERIDDQIAAALSLVLALQGRRRTIARECETIRRTLALTAGPPRP